MLWSSQPSLLESCIQRRSLPIPDKGSDTSHQTGSPIRYLYMPSPLFRFPLFTSYLQLPFSFPPTMSSAHITSTDLLIIGAGPAGLSAALTFARLGRSCVVYDSGSYRNQTSPVTHTIPGFDGADPRNYRMTARKQVEAYDWVKFRDDKVVELSQVRQKMDGLGVGIATKGSFESVDDEGNKVRARKVIIATGIKDNLPGIPGKSIETCRDLPIIQGQDDLLEWLQSIHKLRQRSINPSPSYHPPNRPRLILLTRRTCRHLGNTSHPLRILPWD